jgi:putative redox protein
MSSSASTNSSSSQPSSNAAPQKRIQHTIATWRGEQRFETGRASGGPTAVFDGNAKAGQSPVDALLSALAACSGIDVVDILQKRRTPASHVEVEIRAERREEAPRRLTRLDVEYRVDGEGIDVANAERAVALAFGKYCSVSASLAGDIASYTTLVLNGERQPPVRHALWSAEHDGGA